MNLNKLKEEVYKNAVEHGWYEEERSENHWLCLVIADLIKAMEADKIGKYADCKQFENYMRMKERSEDEFIYAFKHEIKGTVEDKLADACILLLNFAGIEQETLEDTEEYYSAKDFSNETFIESIFDMINTVTEYWQYFDISLILNTIFTFCRRQSIDIKWHIIQKIKYNRYSSHKHRNRKC